MGSEMCIRDSTAAVFFLGAFLANRQPSGRPYIGTKALLSISAVGLAGIGLLSGHLATSIEGHLRVAETSGETAVGAIRDGDLELALASLEITEAELGLAIDHLSGPTVAILRRTPLAAQNLRALDSTITNSHALLGAAHELGDPTERLDSLFRNGRIDPAELAILQARTREINYHTRALENGLHDADSVWLAPPLADAVSLLNERMRPLFAYREQIETISAGLPDILGINGAQSYLVLFGNPAEARELGGFTGALGVLDLADGTFEMQAVARRTLNTTPATASVLQEVPPVRFLEHKAWLWEQNYSAMTDFPTLSRAIRDLFPAMGGNPIDGVIYIDPFALQALVELTGPVHSPSLGRDITASEIPDLLLVGQYELYGPGSERDVFFGELFEGAATALRSDELTIDLDSLRTLSKVVAEDRLLFAPFGTSQLAAADSLGISGRIAPIVADRDYLAVSHLNTGGNKLDPYLERRVNYDVIVDSETQQLFGAVEIELRNNATDDLPAYVAGNVAGRPGTTRSTIVVHTPHEIVEWSGVSGEPELVRSFREFGRWRHEASVTIAPGESQVLSLRIAGELEPNLDDSYSLDIGHQPLAANDSFSVTVRSEHGDPVSSQDFTLTQDVSLTLR